MHDAWSAMNQKDYRLAEQSCQEALKTAGKLGPTDAHVVTNLVFLAGIYQMENKPDLAEKAFQSPPSPAGRRRSGRMRPDLVWPLDKLANFYYFAEHRYDLATPLCLRILHIVEQASPRDDANLLTGRGPWRLFIAFKASMPARNRFSGRPWRWPRTTKMCCPIVC